MPSDFEPDGDEATIVRAVLRLGRRLRVASPAGAFSGGELSLLTTLYRAGPMPAVALAAAEGLAPQSLTRLLRQLEDKAMIARETDPGDRRARIITLTVKGRRGLREAMRARRAWLAGAIAERLDEEERRRLVDAAALMLRLAG